MARKIVVNLDTSKEIYTIFKSKQNDDLILEVNVFENGEGLDLTNKEIAIQALKGDNTYIIQNTDITKLNNTFTAELVRNFTRVPGTTKIEVVLVEGGKQNTTFSFYLEVVGSVIRGAVESKDGITALEKVQEAVTEIGKINEETQTLLNNAGAASKEEINKVNTQLAEMKANKNNQTNLLSKALQKLFTHKQMKFIFQGNSLTYGHDTVSSDKREADTTLCDDGTKHVANRAGVSYPDAMKEYLDKIYPNANHIVINKGYSGDWVERGYQRWNKNSNADIAFIMYGSNDSDLSASWVPSEVRGNLEKFIEDYRKLIERYLRWGTAVVILTPPRTRAQELLTTGRVGEPFRNALILLGKEYNIPVIDTEEFSNGWDSSFYSDGTHFNTKGYRGFASRLVSLLIGFSLIDDVKLYSNENLGVRRTRDNMTVGTSCIFSEAEGSVGQEEFTNNKRLTFHPVNDVGYYSFQTVEDNIVLIPIYGIYGNTNLRFDLDFNTEQGSKTFVADVMYSEYVTAEDKHNPVPSRLVAPNSIGTNSEDMKWILEQAYKNKLYIHITNKGWHNISVEQTNKIGNVSAINGFLVYSYKDFVQLTKEYIRKNVLQLLTHPNWTNSPSDVSTVKILASDLNSIFVGNKINLSEYYKGIPMKITMMNVDNSIVEYSFLWHDNLSASDSSVLSGYRQGFYKNQIPFIEGQIPNRTITSVTYNKDDRSYNIEFGGNLKALSSIIVQPL